LNDGKTTGMVLAKSQMFIRQVNKVIGHACRFLKTQRVFNKPVGAIFEMSNLCNLKCPLCSTGGLKREYTHVERGWMRIETFKTALNKLLPEIESMLLYNWGEPLLNKDVFLCIEYAATKSVKTHLSTNMMMYTEEIGRKLLQSGLTRLTVSCDGMSQETYGKYRTGGDLKKVVASVEHVIAMKKKMLYSHPHIDMQFIVFKHNEKEMKEYEKFWKDKGADSVSFIRMSYMSKRGMDLAKQLDFVPEHPDYQPFHPYGKIKNCADLYFGVTIDWNGDWYTCCFPSGEKPYRVGNILTDDLWKIWNGPKYRYFRRLLKKRRTHKDFYETMCHDCVGIYPKQDALGYWK
jgi:radical SAM protein with 4Fe4S-binding SPASM domain